MTPYRKRQRNPRTKEKGLRRSKEESSGTLGERNQRLEIFGGRMVESETRERN